MNGVEYERRFLVKAGMSFDTERVVEIVQVYLDGFRLRRATENGTVRYTLTVKRATDDPARRIEYEQELHREIGEAMFLNAYAELSVVKRRHYLVAQGQPGIWTVDVFRNANAGLVLLEVEGAEVDVRTVELPSWCDCEVTTEERFTSWHLTMRPVRVWSRNWRARLLGKGTRDG